MDLDLNINFPEAWASDLQCTTFKHAWMKVIGRSLGGSKSLHKFLWGCLKLHDSVDLVKLLIQGFFEVSFTE
jgi:hypothetical protein